MTRCVLRSGVAIIAPRGRLHHDTPVPDELYDSVRQTLDDGYSKILVDFSGVTAIAATGVARLTRALASTCTAESEAIRSFDSSTT